MVSRTSIDEELRISRSGRDLVHVGCRVLPVLDPVCRALHGLRAPRAGDARRQRGPSSPSSSTDVRRGRWPRYPREARGRAPPPPSPQTITESRPDPSRPEDRRECLGNWPAGPVLLRPGSPGLLAETLVEVDVERSFEASFLDWCPAPGPLGASMRARFRRASAREQFEGIDQRTRLRAPVHAAIIPRPVSAQVRKRPDGSTHPR